MKHPTRPTVRTAWAVTCVFAVIQAAATIAPDGAAATVSVAWSLVVFAVGSGMFLWAFLVAADRSRDEPVTVAGVVWLIGSAPPTIARSLRWALAVQVVVAVAAASIRPFSAVAFGVLVPMFGLGTIAWYGARRGVFELVVRPDPPPSDDPADPVGSTVDEPTTGPDVVPGAASERADPDDFDQLFRRRRRRRGDTPE